MEWAIIGVLLVLAFPAMSIVALVKSLNARAEILKLQTRLAALENRSPTVTAAPSEPAPQPAIEMPPDVVQAAEQPVAEETFAEERSVKPISVEQPSVTPPAPVWSMPGAAQPATTQPASAGLEERFGTQWVVWIGGLALALGGIFLVRYSIEAGLIGPGVRIILGALFSTALIGAGEWARRNEATAGFATIPSQHIPSILTAAGTVAAYASVYAAFALYGFISAAVAFVLLGLVALATLAAALLHGPALAGFGIAGAFATPLLIASDEPSYWALYLYLAIVTAAAFALARIRLWRWLASRPWCWARSGRSRASIIPPSRHLERIYSTSSPALRWRPR